MGTVLSPRPVALIYGTNVQAAAGVSVTAEGARVVSIHGMTSSQTVIVQVRLTDGSDWIDYQTVDASKPVALVEFPFTYNRVRVTGLVAGNFVHAQG